MAEKQLCVLNAMLALSAVEKYGSDGQTEWPGLVETNGSVMWAERDHAGESIAPVETAVICSCGVVRAQRQ